MDTLEPILAGHPFFKDLPPEYFKIVVGCACNVRFDPESVIYKEGDDAEKFYLIRHGRVGLEIHVPRKGYITIQTVSDGELLGWSWLIPPYKSRFTARAYELTRAISLDGKCLREKCELDHNFGYEFYKRFSGLIVQRLQATRLQLLDVYSVNH